MKGLLGVALVSLLFGTFLKITSELREEADIGDLDNILLAWTAHFRTPFVTRMALGVTAIGAPWVLALMCVIALGIFLFITRRRWDALQLAAAAIGAGVWTTVGKQVIGRSRPEHPLVPIAGFSYPSGHSLSAAAIYLTLALIAGDATGGFRERAALLALSSIVIGSVGLSRIYLGVHYPSDVLSGILLGSAWALLLETARRYFVPKRSSRLGVLAVLLALASSPC